MGPRRRDAADVLSKCIEAHVGGISTAEPGGGARSVSVGARLGARPRSYTPLEWPGKTCAVGSSSTAQLLTAVAASPKPVAMSFTLPGYVHTSPAL